MAAILPPWAAPSCRTGREVIDALQRLREDGLTVLLVTHDAAVAARADRIVHVQDGRIQNGVPAAVPLSA